MSDPLQVELVAADRVVWSGEATMVIARTAEGDLGALPGHAPVLSILLPSVVEITTTDGEQVRAAVEDGFLSIANDRVSILSEDAVSGRRDRRRRRTRRGREAAGRRRLPRLAASRGQGARRGEDVLTPRA